MKNAALAALGCVLLMSGWMVAQTSDAPKQADSAWTSKALVVFGKISNDGKTLLTDLDSEWAVSNPEIVKGLEGRLVRVKCFVDTEENRIRVLTVRKETGEFNYAARQADSAFRR